jgi:hypothetical protein
MKNATKKHVSQAAYARLKGVTPKTVTVWKKSGLLTFSEDGLVDVEASDARLASRPKVSRGGITKGVSGNASDADLPADLADLPLDGSPAEIAQVLGWSMAEASRVKEIYLALLRRQELAVKQGELVPLRPALRYVEEAFGSFKKELLALPARYGAQIAAEAGCDVSKLDQALTKVIREYLDGLSKPVIR